VVLALVYVLTTAPKESNMNNFRRTRVMRPRDHDFAPRSSLRPEALLVPRNGEGDAANAFVGNATLTALILRIFQNNITPANTDIASGYTEATWTGYTALTLAAASWTVTEANPTTCAYAQQTFTSSAGAQSQACYGYYMTRTTGGRIAVAERFTDGPYTIVNNGDQIKVTPNITFA
jgi:hypothetical protein